MKDMGAVYCSLVLHLAGLRESAVKSLISLEADRNKLEDEIQKAQEQHQTVRRACETHPSLVLF